MRIVTKDAASVRFRVIDCFARVSALLQRFLHRAMAGQALARLEGISTGANIADVLWIWMKGSLAYLVVAGLTRQRTVYRGVKLLCINEPGA